MGEAPGKTGRSLPRGVSVSRSDLWNRPEGGSPLPSDSVQPLDAWPSLPPSLNPKPSRDLDPPAKQREAEQVCRRSLAPGFALLVL